MASMQRPETFHLSLQEQTELPHQVQVALQSIENLKYFLATAPVHFLPEQQIKRFLLPTGEYVSCVLWNGLYHVTGTDIVRCLAFRFSAFGRPVRNAKKFEEGVFSDLRNLKDGNDATLQDPKSAFLDFLYKNNCIRTQKKQKVFYWYSVNYDRLFLDALERDLKREKAGTEPTTEACSEPALSYHWDPSVSLWDQVNSKISGAQPGGYGDGQVVYSRSVSPSGLRAQSAARDSMPPPAMVPSAVSHPPMEPFSDMTPYSHPMVATSNPMQMGSSSTGLMADNGMSMSQPRHASMPASYMEPSPAPSFVSSQGHYDDYSTRGLSYEPITPPQQLNHTSSDNHYSGQPESSFAGSAHGPMYGSMPPPSTSASGGYRNWTHASTNPMLSHIEGSPNYMQHRKRASIGGAYGSTGPSPVQFSRNYMGRRPSDLRRAVSVGLTDGQHHQHQRAVSNPPPQTFGHLQDYRDGSISREGTPVSTIEEFQTMDVYGNYPAGNNNMLGVYGSSPMSTAGAVRRARSATTSEMAAPYPHKTHTCPIPNCSRHFKRLEHLKRHVRTHTQERPFVCQLCNKAFSRSDNLAQHRRTHENGDSSQLNASFTEDEFSQGEGGPIINVEDDVDGHTGFDLSVDAQDSFHSLDAFNNAAAVMGPPPLPTAMANV